MRIHAKIGRGTKEEGLAPLITGAGSNERLADLVYLGLRQTLRILEKLFLSSFQFVVEIRGLRREVFVSQVHRIVHILLRNPTHLHLLLGKFALFLFVALVT